MKKTIIELQSVTKNYGGSRGVTELNLDVQSGTVFGFLGPNGAGKSTTINMLLSFIRPTDGKILLFGEDITESSMSARRRIGFLAGDMAMDRSLNGWQQLEYLGNLRGNFDIEFIKSLAKRLDCNLDVKFKHLSRGNKQKVGLIAALMHKPELLILDEPTSGLDPLVQAEFNKIILEHKADGGTTFISSHVLSEVQEICDHVAFIKDGKLITSKPISQISVESPKNFTVVTKSQDLIKKLTALSGVVIELNRQGTVRGTFSGDVNKFLRLLAGYQLSSFTLTEADLETTFLKYYESGDKDA